MPRHPYPEHDHPLNLSGNNLTIHQVADVARSRAPVALDKVALKAVQESYAALKSLAEGERPVYGVNTGFGIFACCKIPPERSRALSRNLLLSHAVGLGDPFSIDVVRAAMVIRVNSLARGNSGIDPALLTTLIAMLNKDVIPVIPSQGSLGSSGDLAPLAHLALVASRPIDENADDHSGEAFYQGKRMSGRDAMKAAGIPRPVLGPKQGLALINGATFSAAILALALHDTQMLVSAAEAAAALSFEALNALPSALDERLHDARQHPGQVKTARRIQSLLSGSQFTGKTSRVQDPYSLRCAPQIMGPVREILTFSETVLSREINAATDNPLLFDGEAISGGNFHGQPLGLCADYMKIALSELASVAERRIFRLMAGGESAQLPLMLVAKDDMAGFHSGLMMLQYTAASLVLENQHLAAPDSIHSLPTSAGQEDHNANSTTAARHLAELTRNCAYVIAIEFIAAAQAIDIHWLATPDRRLGEGTHRVYKRLRTLTPFVDKDRPLSSDVKNVAEGVLSGSWFTKT